MPPFLTIFYGAFKTAMMEYFQCTSINGFALLYYIRKRKYQRLLWFMFIIMGAAFAVYVVNSTIQTLLQAPTVTVLESDNYRIENVPFPALAVCSTNKLSRRAVEAYSSYMSKRFSEQAQQYTLDKLKLFSGFFDSSAVDPIEAAAFQRDVLDNQNASPFNVTETLKMLAPRCEDLLIVCHWEGKMMNSCMDHFTLYGTADGLCCMFNYRRANQAITGKPLFYPSGTGPIHGLTLLLNTSIADYYVTTRSSSGFTIKMFETDDFPDGTTSGALQEVFIPPGVDVDLQLEAYSQGATNDTRVYSAYQRHCYFNNENDAFLEFFYAQGVCLARCKSRHILSECGCVPYYMPADFKGANESIPQFCTLAHVECLDNAKWNIFRPIYNGVGMPELEHKFGIESLDCDGCFPLCNYNFYIYTKKVEPLNKSYNFPWIKNLFKHPGLNESLSSYSLVKIYFAQDFAIQYCTNALYNWYEILSNFGGIMGICLGCSLLSGFEIVYFFVFRFFEKLCRNTKVSAST